MFNITLEQISLKLILVVRMFKRNNVIGAIKMLQNNYLEDSL